MDNLHACNAMSYSTAMLNVMETGASCLLWGAARWALVYVARNWHISKG